jgi:hypothetical protein
MAFLYNFWVIIYRFSFNEINPKNKNYFYWLTFDYFADFLYLCDIVFKFRTGFLEEGIYHIFNSYIFVVLNNNLVSYKKGVLQTDPIRLRHHYMNSK